MPDVTVKRETRDGRHVYVARCACDGEICGTSGSREGARDAAAHHALFAHPEPTGD